MFIRTAIRGMLFAMVVAALSATSFAQFQISVAIAPPPLPVYEQPVCPGDGYLWTPGYWAYDSDFDDYYWVPGTWVMAPEVGFLWTPPYWGWNGTAFAFYDGYWGPEVGFYGGVAYGFGYFGTGFVGGRWDNGHFFYNRAVVNVNETNIRNVYVENVTNVTVNHVSYNGGNGGITARPTAQQETYARATHTPAVQAQQQQIQAARGNRDLRASVNQGKPAIAATAKAGDFKGNVVAAREAGGTYHPPANGVRAAGANNGRPAAENNARPADNNARPAENNERTETNPSRPVESNNARQAIHPNDLPTAERPPAPNTGNSKLDQKYQKQQDQMVAQQTKERQKLQQQQDKEHAQQQKQQANEAKQQQLEQKHQQQTSQMQQKEAQQMQRMQQKQQPAMHAQSAPAQSAPARKPPE